MGAGKGHPQMIVTAVLECSREDGPLDSLVPVLGTSTVTPLLLPSSYDLTWN